MVLPCTNIDRYEPCLGVLDDHIIIIGSDSHDTTLKQSDDSTFETLSYHQNPAHITHTTTTATTTPTITNNMTTISGTTEPSKTKWINDISFSASWSPPCVLPMASSDCIIDHKCAYVTLFNRLYIIGGGRPDQPQSCVWIYEPISTIISKPIKLEASTSSSKNSNNVIASGKDGWQWQWRRLADLPQARSSPAAVVWRSQIYVIGHNTDDYDIASPIVRYNDDNDTWTTVSSGGQPRTTPKAISVEEGIIRIGGIAAWGAQHDMELWQPLSNTWHSLSLTIPVSFPVPSLPRALYVDGLIVMIGDEHGVWATPWMGLHANYHHPSTWYQLPDYPIYLESPPVALI
jgi:hypothetical protein